MTALQNDIDIEMSPAQMPTDKTAKKGLAAKKHGAARRSQTNAPSGTKSTPCPPQLIDAIITVAEKLASVLPKLVSGQMFEQNG